MDDYTGDPHDWDTPEDVDAVGNSFVSGSTVAVLDPHTRKLHKATIHRSYSGWVVLYGDSGRVQFVTPEWVRQHVVRTPL